MNVDGGTIIVAAITTLPATLIALATLITSIRNGRKVDQIKTATDGMKDALVAATRSDALKEGHAKGVEDERERAP